MSGRRDASRGCERVYVEWQAVDQGYGLTIPEGHME